MLSGNVLITGGAGFLGRAIIRRSHREGWPAHFTVLSRDETKQWQIKHRWPDVRCVLGDVARDRDYLIGVMAGHETVIHAAAIKYIPEAEWNVRETVEINVMGSRNVAQAALAAGVSRVVGISTDKACTPLNTYGLTKALMERIFSEAGLHGPTRFATVRFGNLVGSTGSAIPLFQRQIEEFGELRLTHGDMTRFWLSADEGVDLIDRSITELDNHPSLTLIGANSAMSIVDLAHAVWELFGRHNIHAERLLSSEPSIVFTGPRPGEKLHETLLSGLEVSHAYRLGTDAEWSSPTPCFVLLPFTEPRVDSADIPEQGYLSSSPISWLSRDLMIEYMLDAKDI